MAFLHPILPVTKRFLAIVWSTCLIWTSAGVGEAAKMAPDLFQIPGFLPQVQLNPPSQLGHIVDYFNADDSAEKQKLVILIQDLHINYGVQKNISALLNFFAAKLATTTSSKKEPTATIPFALAVEGAQGLIDTSVLAKFPDPKIKKEAMEYFLREGEINGMEYFAAEKDLSNLLVGVEDERYYNAHRELFRRSNYDREELVENLTKIQRDVEMLAPRVFSEKLAEVQKKIDGYDKGQLGTQEFIQYFASQVGPDELKTRFPELAAYWVNSAADVRESNKLRALTSAFLQQTSPTFTGKERATLQFLAKQTNSRDYFLYRP